MTDLKPISYLIIKSELPGIKSGDTVDWETLVFAASSFDFQTLSSSIQFLIYKNSKQISVIGIAKGLIDETSPEFVLQQSGSSGRVPYDLNSKL